MRTLASIQTVINVQPIVGADSIERVDVLGWQCVAKKGEFKVNDKVVYVEIDSLVPHAPWSSFLWKAGDAGKNNLRLKTIKLRGQISQGLVLPLSVLDGKKFASDQRDNPVYEWTNGQEVTPLLGITKFEPVIPAQLAGLVKGKFPCFIPKTDEIRIQAAPEALAEFKDKLVYITTKCDGSSGTFYYNNGEFGVCSRNLEFTQDGTNAFWKVALKYDLPNKLKAYGKNIAIQGEVCGPGIQKNRMGLKELDLFVFNIYDIDAGKYINYHDFVSIAKADLLLKTVPVDYVGPFNHEWTVESLLEMSRGKYIGTDQHREGMVVRTVTEGNSVNLKGRMSFKVINNDFLLKGGD